MPDRDVIITPGTTTPLTITDPFKAAKVLLQAKDDKTGKLLPSSTVNIGTGGETVLTLTTGAKGTATGELPVTSRKAEFWVKQIKAPAGYDLYKPARMFTAGPGAPVTVTVTNAKTSTGTPSLPDPTDTPAPEKPGGNESTPSPSASHPGSDTTAPVTDEAESSPTSPPPGPDGALAHTGANTTPWLAAGGALLLVTGAAAVVATRTRRTGNVGDSPTEG
ncbi:LPXTG cell wall anchor domain-containing protein [Streptomyces niveus]|uniref:LPXTG cell wall anchor domain-containing protein n=1 Tax=Streptomyces niveus TaxID=193462 RepID=UPI0035D9BC8E